MRQSPAPLSLLGSRLGSLLGALSLAACVAEPVAPAARPRPSGAVASTAAAAAADPDAIPGQYLVAARGSGFAQDFASAVTSLGGTIVYAHQGAGVAVVSELSSTAAASLGTRADVADVENDITVSLDAKTDSSSVAGETAADATAVGTTPSAANPAGAKFFARQWNMRDIGAPTAWNAGRLGSPTVRVAILDTGIDFDHPDLAGRVDLANSATFTPRDDALADQLFPGKNHCIDMYFHGTHVAATVSSNAVLAAGVTSRVTLMCVKVLNRFAIGGFGTILPGVLFAADHGADVANLSLSGGFAKAGRGRLLGLINRVFTYAQRQGMLIVVSAGNNSADLDHDGNFFAGYCAQANVVCVAATGPTSQASVIGPWTDVDAPAWYTNYGRSAISVAAPGGNGPPDGAGADAYVFAACSEYTLAPGLAACRDRTHPRIVGAEGTSMAAPHVTALAALLVEQYGRNPQRIRQALEQSADDLGQPGTDPFYGKGRIDVARALGF